MDHATRAVLAQRQVNGASGEVPGFQPLLGDLDLTGTVVTADALHTHGDAAEFLVTRKHAHYLFTVKANQCAARRLAVSPNGVGRDSKRYLWVRWLTWIRKEKGTRACQRTGGQAQASGMTRRVTRVIWRKLNCLNPNLQRMPLCIHRKDARNRCRPCMGMLVGLVHSSRLERCPVRALKKMSGAPTSRYDVQQGRTRDRLRDASPTATECL
jgi:hypothetical protein